MLGQVADYKDSIGKSQGAVDLFESVGKFDARICFKARSADMYIADHRKIGKSLAIGCQIGIGSICRRRHLRSDGICRRSCCRRRCRAVPRTRCEHRAKKCEHQHKREQARKCEFFHCIVPPRNIFARFADILPNFANRKNICQVTHFLCKICILV